MHRADNPSIEFTIKCEILLVSIDEATNRTLEQQLILYVAYLSNNGKGPHVTRFVEFLALRDGTITSMYKVVIGLLEKMHYMHLNEVALAIHGASSMTGNHT